MPWPGKAVLDIEIGARAFEGVAQDWQLLGTHVLDVLGCPAVSGVRRVLVAGIIDTEVSRQIKKSVSYMRAICLFPESISNCYAGCA